MQLEFFDVPSPCIAICQLNDKGQCLGCFRTRAERQTWTSINSDEKQKVIKRCLQRKKRLANKAAVTANTEKLNSVSGNVNSKVTPLESNTEGSDAIQPSLLDPPKKITLDTSTDFDFDDFEL